MAETPRQPLWWTADWPYDPAVGVARDGVAVTAGPAVVRLEGVPTDFRVLKEKVGVTPPSVTGSVTPPESVTPSAADRKRDWRKKNRDRSRQINRGSKAKRRKEKEREAAWK